MVVLVACSIFAPLLAPHDPTEISMLDSRLAPGEDPSYLLGTDIMGRDMLSRLIYGARTAMFISLVPWERGCWWGPYWGW
jgi:peptide/nickel transport system permease protein